MKIEATNAAEQVRLHAQHTPQPCTHSTTTHSSALSLQVSTPFLQRPPTPTLAVNLTPETKQTKQARMYGRHFEHTDQLVSRISRESINALKAHFTDEMSKDDWRLVSFFWGGGGRLVFLSKSGGMK
jgi:hypothetical protein